MTLRIVSTGNAERNSIKKTQESFEFFTKVLDSDDDYSSSCVFTGETEFNVNEKRSEGDQKVEL